MISNEEIRVYQETCRGTRMALDTLDTILSKVYDEELAYELNLQANRYREIQRKAQQAMEREGLKAKEGGRMEKALLWSAIQAGTLLNISTAHVADMVIQGNTRGLIDLKKVTHNNKKTGSYANEIAGELMDFEEKNIQKLKSYVDYDTMSGK